MIGARGEQREGRVERTADLRLVARAQLWRAVEPERGHRAQGLLLAEYAPRRSLYEARSGPVVGAVDEVAIPATARLPSGQRADVGVLRRGVEAQVERAADLHRLAERRRVEAGRAADRDRGRRGGGG